MNIQHAAEWACRLRETLEAVGTPAAVYLYGSHVRGTARPDSDYDLLVIVGDTLSVAERERLLSAIYQFGIENDIVFSCAVFRQSEWERLRRLSTPFATTVNKEAILLWKNEKRLSSTA